MNGDEKAALHFLARAWNKFLDLPEERPQDRIEFLAAIHAAQNIILARAMLRQTYENIRGIMEKTDGD